MDFRCQFRNLMSVLRQKSIWAVLWCPELTCSISKGSSSSIQHLAGMQALSRRGLNLIFDVWWENLLSTWIESAASLLPSPHSISVVFWKCKWMTSPYSKQGPEEWARKWGALLHFPSEQKMQTCSMRVCNNPAACLGEGGKKAQGWNSWPKDAGEGGAAGLVLICQ